MMMEKSNSQYDSFLFWRQPIPPLDLDELEDLGFIDCPRRGQDSMGQEEEEELSQFSSFNYWRAPIVSVDALLDDLNLLL
uniref:protein AF1q n=1 Tax=Doryrhamphus excisus TaxID=161450 RepID=UPI0025AE00CA|nr:protein AF1q [Doryrhamphus excisus]XP_057902975.1 protein AF1q [Doryrhamphus excisus]